MAHVLVTGSADGIGRITARRLAEEGHRVVLHARTRERLSGAQDLLEAGAEVVLGDLAEADQVRDLARQAAELGPLDAVIHNAGVMDGPQLLAVNVVAPWLLTTLLPTGRQVYLSSSMHRGGRPDASLLDDPGRAGYSDSKLLLTTLAMAVARRRPEVLGHAVDPGWVPTRMGGPSAPDDLELGALTQRWLATTDEEQALRPGGYWHHQRRQEPHPAALDAGFQDELLERLEQATGCTL
ncbi:SDR family NAD(P)-dependent oxidoreductase [Luteococcus peritonei]|uniref:SDR family NAD(P)-dependent oxidoreductase n=1 Tax=Luteococcus peritonei TaxID=88874 RepID=A0ABW4S1N5_9ACTN